MNHPCGVGRIKVAPLERRAPSPDPAESPMPADLRYPVGKFARPATLTPEQRAQAIDDIASLPAKMRAAVNGLTPRQLDTPYRPEGWTVRQVAHHVPDSHLNAYTRFKLAVTEDEPTIRPYDEARWATLEEARTAPPEVSLLLLDALHQRWTLFLNTLEPAHFARRLVHPEDGPMTVDMLLAMYSWHSRHHLAHITNLRERLGWV